MKKDYMARLEWAARWRLPPQEANDVIADYRDIVGDPPRPEDELLRDLGSPRAAIRPLTPQKQYRVWLAVFALLAACPLLPGLGPLPGMWRLWDFCLRTRIFGLYINDILPFLGMACALIWFRWKGQKQGRLPRAVPALLAVAAACTVAVLAVDWVWMRDPVGFSALLGEVPVRVLGIFPLGWTRPTTVLLLNDTLGWVGCFAMALLALLGLVKARTGDRRWAAVYILALTAVLVSAETLAFLNNMEIGGNITPDWWMPYLRLWAIHAGMGLVGAGVALC